MPEALCNLGSGSWLAWANDTVLHYAVVHCLRRWTVGPTVHYSRWPFVRSSQPSIPAC